MPRCLLASRRKSRPCLKKQRKRPPENPSSRNKIGRQAALDYEPAPEFFAAIRQRQGIAAGALEVTLLTALRSGEVKWTEIDLEGKTWVIPPERLKDRKTRTEPQRCRLKW
jgi:hypothetical protein